MMKLPKDIITTLAVSASLHTSVQAEPLNLDAFRSASQPEKNGIREEVIPIYDRHIVLVFDKSGSVTYAQKEAMMRGVAEAFASDTSKIHFDENVRYAVTIVYFAGEAKSLPTVFIGNQEEAITKISQLLWNFEEEKPATFFEEVGSNTNMYNALSYVASLFDHERVNNFKSISKSVVVMADSIPQSGDSVADQVFLLGNQYGATVYGLPVVLEETSATVGQNEVVQFFERAVMTQANVKHETGWDSFNIPPGRTEPMMTYGDAFDVIDKALNVKMN